MRKYQVRKTSEELAEAGHRIRKYTVHKHRSVMSSEEEPLKDIFVDDYESLMSQLGEDFPEALTFYGWLKSKLSWMKKEPQQQTIHVCSLEGDHKDNGIVFFGDLRGRCSIITVFLYKNDFSKLGPALMRTKKIKWDESPTVAINIEKSKELEDIMENLGYRVYTDAGSKLWQLSVEEALSFDLDCPEDVYLAPLKPEDIPLVNSLWSLKFEGSEKNLMDLTELNSSIGLYTKEDNRLMSWAVECEYSEIGVLYTLPEYRKRGYARLVTKALAKKIAIDKQFVITYTISGNVAAERFFQRLGFKYMCQYGFLEYEKK